jgi:hypothetical protein
MVNKWANNNAPEMKFFNMHAQPFFFKVEIVDGNAAM